VCYRGRNPNEKIAKYIKGKCGWEIADSTKKSAVILKEHRRIRDSRKNAIYIYIYMDADKEPQREGKQEGRDKATSAMLMGILAMPLALLSITWFVVMLYTNAFASFQVKLIRPVSSDLKREILSQQSNEKGGREGGRRESRGRGTR